MFTIKFIREPCYLLQYRMMAKTTVHSSKNWNITSMNFLVVLLIGGAYRQFVEHLENRIESNC